MHAASGASQSVAFAMANNARLKPRLPRQAPQAIAQPTRKLPVSTFPRPINRDRSVGQESAADRVLTPYLRLLRSQISAAIEPTTAMAAIPEVASTSGT